MTKRKIYETEDYSEELNGKYTTLPLLKDYIKDLQEIYDDHKRRNREDISIDIRATGYEHVEISVISVSLETDEAYKQRMYETELKDLLEEQKKIKKLMKAAKTMIDFDLHAGVSLDTYSTKLKRIRERIAEISKERKK